MVRVLPAPLIAVSLAADLSGRHGFALAALLVAIPVAFAFALECYGDALEARCGGLRPLFAGISLALLVVSAALRSAAGGGPVPHVAVSALVLCLLLYLGIALGSLLPSGRTLPTGTGG